MRLAILASAITTLAVTTPADAALLQFTISGSDTLSGIDPVPDIFVSFRIDSDPAVDPVNVRFDEGFFVTDVEGIFRYGATVFSTPQPIGFFSDDLDGGLLIGNPQLLAFDGPRLYTGSEDSPRFLTGSFALTNFINGSALSLTISEVPAVPEPATWMTMLAGFAMIGGATRYRRRKATVAYA